MTQTYPYYLAGRAESPNSDLEVIDKFSGEVAARVALADETAIDAAIGAAVTAARPMAEMAAYERQAVLHHCVRRFEERSEELAQLLCADFLQQQAGDMLGTSPIMLQARSDQMRPDQIR